MPDHTRINTLIAWYTNNIIRMVYVCRKRIAIVFGTFALFLEVIDRIVLILFHDQIRNSWVGEEYGFSYWILEQ